MDFTTTSTTVRRDTKTATFSQAALCALASTAAMNALDPENTATFASHDATPNADGTITVSLVVEIEVPSVVAPVAAAAAVTPSIPPGIGAPA